MSFALSVQPGRHDSVLLARLRSGVRRLLGVCAAACFVALVVQPVAAQSGYWTRSLEDGNAVLTGIDCADSMNCMSIGMESLFGESHVLKTTDGGETWRITWSEKAIELQRAVLQIYDIAYPTPQVALVAADSGCIHRTTNGGATWVVDTVAVTALAVNRISMFDDRHGVALLHGQGRMFKTSTGGERWSELPTASIIREQWRPSDLFLADVHQTSATDILCFLQDDSIRATSISTDGGSTWKFNADAFPGVVGRPQPGYRFPWLTGSSFATASDGWFFARLAPDSVGLPARTVLLRTTDGGTQWNLILDSGGVFGNGLTRILFRDTSTGIATAPYHVLRTQDGGRTWSADSIRDGVPVYLPRRGPNLRVGIGAWKWLYHFEDVPSAITDGSGIATNQGAAVRHVGQRLLIQSGARGCHELAVAIYSVLGRRLRAIGVEPVKGLYTVDLLGLPSGGYILEEKSCEGTTHYQFVVGASRE